MSTGRRRVWELRYGLLYLPLCVVPMALVLASSRVETSDPVQLFLTLMVALSCLLSLVLTWQLYRQGVLAERQRRFRFTVFLHEHVRRVGLGARARYEDFTEC